MQNADRVSRSPVLFTACLQRNMDVYAKYQENLDAALSARAEEHEEEEEHDE